MTAPLTFADELLAMLPTIIATHPLGATIDEAGRRLASPRQFVREAFDTLNAEGRAIMVRRRGGRVIYLVPSDYPITACKNCHVEFEPKWKAKCCSRACSISWSWRQPGVAEKRKAGIRAERKSPEAKARLAAHNKRRWAKPEEHAKLSEQNRRQWANPVYRAKRSAGIQAANGSPEARRAWSKLRSKAWAENRERYVEAMRSRGPKYSWQGRKLYLVELAELSGINLRTLRERLVYKGWPIEEAMKPVDCRFRRAA